jgi:hypothetical protein
MAAECWYSDSAPAYLTWIKVRHPGTDHGGRRRAPGARKIPEATVSDLPLNSVLRHDREIRADKARAQDPGHFRPFAGAVVMFVISGLLSVAICGLPG